ncbi:MAG: hypothetical protein PHS41_12255 [Victivallaceae bacterium]|nr:hypothetical protein [Victivallaceae bacterium]
MAARRRKNYENLRRYVYTGGYARLDGYRPAESPAWRSRRRRTVLVGVTVAIYVTGLAAMLL